MNKSCDCKKFASKYRDGVSGERLLDEVLHLKAIHRANMNDKSLSLLNKNHKAEVGSFIS